MSYGSLFSVTILVESICRNARVQPKIEKTLYQRKLIITWFNQLY